MPSIKPNESQSDYMTRCIPQLINGEGLPQKEAIARCFSYWEKAKSKALTKRVGSQDLPSSAFLIVEDAEKTTTWHLPVKKYDGDSLVADHGRMGAAWAALHGGYRGNKYDGPDKTDAITKLEKLYESEGLDTPSAKDISTQKDFTGAMIGFFLSLPVAVSLDMAARNLPFYVERSKPRDYHLTLAYLGDTLETDFDQGAIKKAVSDFAKTRNPIKGRFAGIGRMSKSDDGKNAVYVSFDSPDLPDFRQGLIDSLKSIGVFSNPEHGFIPHITVGYIGDFIEDMPVIELPEIDFEFDKITVAFGDDRFDYDLGMSETKKELSSFTVYKDKETGAFRWLAISSNSYRDREGEILSKAALEADVNRSDLATNKNFGPLRWWHVGGYDPITRNATPGLDVGDCDFRMMRGKFLVESGTFRNQVVAKSLSGGDWRISVRFLHPPNEPDSEGVYHNIKIFERSLIPTGKESNPFTAFHAVEIEEFNMVDKIKAFKDLLDDPGAVTELIEFVDAREKELDKSGVKSKENGSDEKKLIAKLKSLLSIGDDPAPAPDPQPVTTAKEISDAVTAGIIAAFRANQTAQKDAVDAATEKAHTDQVKALTDRIEKLEGDFNDANAELKVAQKELSELVGNPGYRASQADDNTIVPEQKDLTTQSGLTDFTNQLFGNPKIS